MALAPTSPARRNRPPSSAADRRSPARGLPHRAAGTGAVLGGLLAFTLPFTVPRTEARSLPASEVAQAPAAPIDPLAAGLRAANVARMYAERLNGGLGVYRTQACMHSNRGGDCLIRRDRQGYLFRFLGGPPGWQQLNLPATVETEILVSPDGTRVERMIYNGNPRGETATAP